MLDHPRCHELSSVRVCATAYHRVAIAASSLHAIFCLLDVSMHLTAGSLPACHELVVLLKRMGLREMLFFRKFGWRWFMMMIFSEMRGVWDV